jgi:two-component sensor histidine kinase
MSYRGGSPIDRSGSMELIYQDSGRGLPKDFEQGSSSIGLLLVKNIVENQLNGQMEIKNDGGFFCRIVVDLGVYEARI